MKKLIAIDLDGTTLNQDSKLLIKPRELYAVRFKMVTLSSSRPDALTA